MARITPVSMLATPLRGFLGTETGSAAVLLVATMAALVWANASFSSYSAFWQTRLVLSLGGARLDLSLQGFVNTGLMSFFFLVVGLEARREFDLGELRERRRVVLPALAGLGGMAVPVGIYLVANAGHASELGWGTTMSTDTAFALGVLALVGPSRSSRLRSYLLTLSVVDDVAALCVIAAAYAHAIHALPLLVAAGLLAGVLALRAAGVRYGLVYAAFGVAMWVATYASGIDPVVVGLLTGLTAVAYPASRPDLERATERFRLFREQPTAELAREASFGVRVAISPNERLQQLYHPWSSYVVVPLFALANAGIHLDGGVLSRAFVSPVTLGILVGYVVGKPLGIVATSVLATRLSGRRLRSGVGWASIGGAGSVAGIGFTVSILVASLAFHGSELEQAKIGVLAAAVVASAVTFGFFRCVRLLPPRRRVRAIEGTASMLTDLADPVDPARDHVRGPQDALVTLVEYGDFECPYCGQAEPVVRELLSDFGDLRYVWRHLPLADVHPHAELAAEAAEAAGAQGAFWEMHDLLFEHQDALKTSDLVGYAALLGLDADRFASDLARRSAAGRIAADVEGADLSGVGGTPTFFVNGRRHFGAYEVDALAAAVEAAHRRAELT